MTIEEFGRKLRARETSAIETVEACLARIEGDGGRLNAFILSLPDEARAEARKVDAELAAGRDRGPLHGVPMSVKDLFDIRGTPTTAASRVRDGRLVAEDAPAIAALRRAGAIVVGKTNLHEFAFGTTNEDSAFGPVRNPIDTTRSPGGSSGGSAVSIVAGMALASVGTDTGGSIRIPASACGIVGLKPGYGEISTDRVVPLARSLDHAGPLAQTVTDAWCVYHGLLGRPAQRPLSARPLDGLPLVVLREYFCEVLDDEVRGSFERSVDGLARKGARLAEATIPHASSISDVYRTISFGEAAAYHAPMLDTMADRYTAPVRERLELARQVRAEEYIRALDARALLRDQVNAALSNGEALILPTLPIPAPPLGATEWKIGSRSEPVRALMLRDTQLFNLTGHPAISLPCGLTGAGLPCGLQLVGATGHTEALLRVAVSIERALRNGAEG
jgi:aspartyl-tRNA(Asn)/glutamyl-tRNA(Gln) amidotransferase subunit A